MGKKDPNKPRGKMSSYAFFVQTCREEHRKKHPSDKVQFAEFSKKCAEKWKTMGPKEKKRFEEMAEKDKARYDREMSTYDPPGGMEGKGKKRKRTKDPNAPKRALSAFFFFCNEERPAVRKVLPEGSGVGDVAKELGKRWEQVKERSRFETLAAGDRARYEKEMAIYKGKKVKPVKEVVRKPPPPSESEEEDDDDEEEDDDDEEDDE